MPCLCADTDRAPLAGGDRRVSSNRAASVSQGPVARPFAANGIRRHSGSPAELVQNFNVDLVSVLTGLEVSTTPFRHVHRQFHPLPRQPAWRFSGSTQSYGPKTFGKRSLTIGKGKVSAGFNWLHAKYDSLGVSILSNGDLRPVKNVRFAGGPATAAGSSLILDISSDTYVGFASYGLTDNIDVGVACRGCAFHRQQRRPLQMTRRRRRTRAAIGAAQLRGGWRW